MTSYEDKVKKGSDLRVEINDVHHARYGALKNIFKEFFQMAPSDFKRLVDLKHYDGGYPSPDSLPRRESLAKYVSSMLTLQDFVGDESLKRALAARGIEVKINSSLTPRTINEVTQNMDSKVYDKVTNASKVSGFKLEDFKDTREMLKALIAEGDSIQTTICSLADEIKIDLGEAAEKEDKILKSNFVKAVSIEAKRGRKNFHDTIEKSLERVENMEKSLEIFSKDV